MNASQILDEQIIHVKRGRMNGLGFEPAFNSYFDFYLSPKYIDPPLIKLEDAMFHLFLRKNLNDRNPQWKMPSFRQMKKRLAISQDKIEVMIKRLHDAHLLQKQSGYRKGDEGENLPNTYLLSDPIPTLEEFLVVAGAGAFPRPLQEEWQGFVETRQSVQVSDLAYTEERYTPVPESGTPPVPESSTYKQTLKSKQTSENSVDPRWEKSLEELKMQMPKNTFDMFLGGTKLVSVEDAVAVVRITNAYAKDWVEQRLGSKIARSLGVDSIRCVVQSE